VYLKHGRYYLVTLPDRRWFALTREAEGLPAMYRAYAALVERDARRDTLAQVITRWCDAKRAVWSAGVAADQDRIAAAMAHAWADVKPSEVTAPLCAEYLRRYAHQPRTHNMHRTMLRGVLSLAAVEGLREGHNPVDDIQPLTLQRRVRIVTDDELQAIQSAALAGRYGVGLCRMIDLALLTGQRIGDLIGLRWQDVTTEGVAVVQQKTRERLLIEWSPALRAAVDACADGRARIGHVLKTETGGAYTYAGIRSAWVRACSKAGVADLHIHDLRGRAGVDAMGEDQDIRAAQKLLGHKGEAMTRAYVEQKYAKRVKPAR
jgi:integrase